MEFEDWLRGSTHRVNKRSKRVSRIKQELYGSPQACQGFLGSSSLINNLALAFRIVVL